MNDKTEIQLIDTTFQITAKDFIDKADDIFERIKAEVDSIDYDPTTKAGRMLRRSVAHTVAMHKVFSKKHEAYKKEQGKRVDNAEKSFRDKCDSLKAEILEPVLEWDRKEQERVEAIKLNNYER